MVVLIFYRTIVNTDFDYSTLTSYQLFLIVLNGLIQALMQLCWIKALFVDKAGRVASLTFLGIVIGYIIDMIAFNYHMQVFEVLGATLIVACSVIVFVLKLTKYSE